LGNYDEGRKTSTISKDLIKNIDTKAADHAPGAIKVITHLNAPKMKVTFK